VAGMGPPPKPAGQRARRNATVAMVQLPAAGFAGPVPPWPLPADVGVTALVDLLTAEVRAAERMADDEGATGKARAAARRKLTGLRVQLAEARARKRESGRHERAIWAELWRTPQAAAWARMGWTREVAQYARLKAAAELGDLDAAKEARQHADRLGLSPLALLRLRWEVAPDELADRRDPAPATAPAPARPAVGARERYAGLRVAGGTDAVAGS
jgi:hypothetical protein